MVRFRKSIKIAKGVRLNLGSKSAGISIGGKGARIGYNTKRGSYISAGIPKTGLYTVQYFGSNKSRKSQSNQSEHYNSVVDQLPLPPELQLNTGLGCAWSFLTVILISSVPLLGFASLAGQLYAWHKDNNSPRGKARTLFLDGKSFYLKNDFEMAIDKFNDVLTVYPTLYNLHSILGDMYMGNNALKEAIYHFEEFLKHQDDIDIKFKLAKVYQQDKQQDKAISLLQSFPVEYKQMLGVICVLGLCFMQQEKYDTALEVLLTGPTKKRNMDDDIAMFRYLLGLCYQELGQNKKALSQYNKVIAYDTNFEDVSNKISECNS